MNKIVFAGGNSRLRGLPDRVILEFDRLWKNNLNFQGDKATPSTERVKAREVAKKVNLQFPAELLSYQGLCLMSQVIQPEHFVTQKEWKEVGATIFKRKNLSEAAILK